MSKQPTFLPVNVRDSLAYGAQFTCRLTPPTETAAYLCHSRKLADPVSAWNYRLDDGEMQPKMKFVFWNLF